MLEALQPDTLEGRVYEALVRLPKANVSDLATATSMDEFQVRNTLSRLTSNHVVTDLGANGNGPWEPQPPELITETALRAHERHSAAMRAAGGQLSQLFRFARRAAGQYPGIEVISDDATMKTQFEQLQYDARHQVRIIDRPPYVSHSADEYAEQCSRQQARMAAGVRYRTIYHSSIYEDPLRCGTLMPLMAAGEQARVLRRPPMKVAIKDEECALVPLESDGVALMIHPSGLLHMIVDVFESLWQLAMPISSAQQGVDPLEPRDRQILTLMAAGATDETIARRLGLSRRTVVRRTAVLLERLGASTRFQAGVQAARRSWL